MIDRECAEVVVETTTAIASELVFCFLFVVGRALGRR